MIRTLTTHTMWTMFRSCRKACEWRYVQHLVPLEENPALRFGSVIHRALEVWHRERDLVLALAEIDRSYPNRAQDESERAEWHNAIAMMRGYASRYPSEVFEVVHLEKCFEGPIVNPATGACSRRFSFGGRIDGIVRLDGRYFVLEHKTTTRAVESYVESLWLNPQPAAYAIYAQRALGVPVAGVLWNVLAKARLQQAKGETEAEYLRRRQRLAAKNKSGVSTAARRLPESDESFQARLAEKYAEPGMFRRVPVLFDAARLEQVEADIWELTQSFLEARRRGTFYPNPSFCFHHGSPCPYLPLCRTGGDPMLVEHCFRRVEPHEELRSEATRPIERSTTTP